MASTNIRNIVASFMLLVAFTSAFPQPKPVFSDVQKRTHGHDTSTSWCGAVYETPSTGSNFASVVGTFTIPTVSAGAPGPSSWGGYIWTGIGGWETDAILQGGAGWNVTSGEDPYYYVWTEWYPANPRGVDGFAVKPGDSLTVTATAASDSAGSIIFENQSSGETKTVSLTAPDPTATLIQTNAAWVIEAYCTEDLCANGGHAPLADFGTVTISDCEAGLVNGQSIDLVDATIVDLTEERAFAKIPTDSEVIITYG